LKNASLNRNYNNLLAKNLFRLKSVCLIGIFIFISCEDTNNLLVTEKEAKTSNGRFELSLKIDPDIVYTNSTTKVTATIVRSMHKDSLASAPDMYCKMNAVGGKLEIHTQFSGDWVTVALSDSINSTWEGLAFFVPDTGSDLKNTGHVSAIFDGMNLTLPIKLVAAR